MKKILKKSIPLLLSLLMLSTGLVSAFADNNNCKLTIGDLLDTYMYAERPYNFEGIICDADSQAVAVIFNSQRKGKQTYYHVIEIKTKPIQQALKIGVTPWNQNNTKSGAKVS